MVTKAIARPHCRSTDLLKSGFDAPKQRRAETPPPRLRAPKPRGAPLPTATPKSARKKRPCALVTRRNDPVSGGSGAPWASRPPRSSSSAGSKKAAGLKPEGTLIRTEGVPDDEGGKVPELDEPCSFVHREKAIRCGSAGQLCVGGLASSSSSSSSSSRWWWWWWLLSSRGRPPEPPGEL